MCKLNRHYIRKLLVFTALSIFLFGCKKEIDEFLLGDFKKQNPYIGNETLIFINEIGETIVFDGEGRYSETFRTESESNPKRYYTNELDKCVFESRNGDYEFEIVLTTHKDRAFQMSITIFRIINQPSHWCYCYSLYYQALQNYYGRQDMYLDSLQVLDKMYYDIMVDSSLSISTYFPDDSCHRFVSNLFYTINNGIIRLDFDDGSTWELKEILN